MDVGRPTTSSANQGSSSVSLYKQTMMLIEKLYCIPGFDKYLFPEGIDNYLGNPVLMDPVAVIWYCFRLGSPFCYLYNQLRPVHLLPVPEIPQNGQTYSRTCKKAVYDFVVACKEELGMRERDLFSISGLYKDDTNEFVQLIKTINIILTRIEDRGYMPPPRKLPFNVPTTDASTNLKDNRTKLIAELLNTERLYTSDLEKLQNFKILCKMSNTISRDIILKLFANLDDLLDFQRRFLLQMEACLSMPTNEQRVGALFLQNEDSFSVYIPFCANYPAALELAVEKSSLLTQVSADMDPRMLQNYLIKPIQRVCKYPLLLQELVKLSKDTGYAYMDELNAGTEAVRRVTDRVNEEKRNEENRALKRTLIEKVEDWKNLNPSDFGDLVLSDHFPMTVGESEREYELFLFERILLCCKIVTKKSKKSKKASTPKSGEEGIQSYVLKGNIFIERIDSIIDSSRPELKVFQIKVFWKDSEDLESFILRCRNVEQVHLWYDRIESLLNIAKLRRMSLNDPYGSNRGGLSNGMKFRPSYDFSEFDGSFDSNRNSDQYKHNNGMGRQSVSSFNGNNNEYALLQQQQLQQQITYNNNRRSSPAPARTSFSQANGIKQSASSNVPLSAMANMGSTSSGQRTSIPSRHRSQSPNNRYGMPPPSSSSRGSLNDLNEANDARMRDSNRVKPRSRGMSLSHNYAYKNSGQQQDYTNLEYIPPVGHGNSGQYQNNYDKSDVSEELPPSPPLTTPHSPENILNNQNGGVPLGKSGRSGSDGVLLNESSSRYNQRSNAHSSERHEMPRMISTPHISTSNTGSSYQNQSNGIRQSSSLLDVANNSSSASSNGGSSNVNRYPAQQYKYSNESLLNPQQGNQLPVPSIRKSSDTGGLPSVRIKAHYGTDIFMIAVPISVTFNQLLSKLEHKVKLCSSLPPNGILRIKYKDEDNDLIAIYGDEDIELAIDTAGGVGSTVCLWLS